MDREAWFQKKWAWVPRLGVLALAGVILIAAGLGLELGALMAFGVFALFPIILFVVVVSILHWKERYIGHNSNLWGALLVLETSGWFKIVYWFRHVLPDRRRSGRYRDAP
jgi:hypothetical protein